MSVTAAVLRCKRYNASLPQRIVYAFCGQGSHSKGMGLEALSEPHTPQWEALIDAKEHCELELGYNLLTLLRENPTSLSVKGVNVVHDDGVLGYTQLAQVGMLSSQYSTFLKARANVEALADGIACSPNPPVFVGHSLGEYTALAAMGVLPLTNTLSIVHERGRCMQNVVGPMRTAGTVSSSTGTVELTALKRHYRLYAVSCTRAKVNEDALCSLVESVAQALELELRAGELLEVVNYNATQEQYVVAGSLLALNVMGKVVDPQWRRGVADGIRDRLMQSHSADIRGMSGALLVQLTSNGAWKLEENVRRKIVSEYVSLAVAEAHEDVRENIDGREEAAEVVAYPKVGTGRMPIVTPAGVDGGIVPSDDRFVDVMRDGQARSGLRTRPWFVRLKDVEVPFHSSALRPAMDSYFDILCSTFLGCGSSCIADDELVDATTRKASWVCNLTGSRFDPGAGSVFRQRAAEAVDSMNIGEQERPGAYVSTSRQDIVKMCLHGSARELLVAVLAGQVAHPVLWIDSLESLVQAESADAEQLLMVELAPKATLVPLLESEVKQKGSSHAARWSGGITLPKDFEVETQ